MLGRGAEAAAAAAAAEKERKRDRERGRSRRSGFIGDPDGFRFRGYVEREERTGEERTGVGSAQSMHAPSGRDQSLQKFVHKFDRRSMGRFLSGSAFLSDS